jgi:hypothetical protein
MDSPSFLLFSHSVPDGVHGSFRGGALFAVAIAEKGAAIISFLDFSISC